MTYEQMFDIMTVANICSVELEGSLMSENSGLAPRVSGSASFFHAHYLVRPRFAVFLAVAALVLGILLGLLMSGLNSRSASAAGLVASNATPDLALVSVVVERGDSIWSIAVKYGAAGVDPRKTVASIRAANHLASALVFPGQTLLVPTAKR